jgi:hypothetical protein
LNVDCNMRRHFKTTQDFYEISTFTSISDA